jgi:hypothetical protein
LDQGELLHEELLGVNPLERDGGRPPLASLLRGVDSAESETHGAESGEELEPELQEFIDQLIVPLLVERLRAENGVPV